MRTPVLNTMWVRCWYVALAALLLQPPTGVQASLWINEFHYDNSGSDVGEFVELVVTPDMSGVDLSTVTVTFYNGGNGQPYSSVALNDSSVTAGASVSGFQFYSFGKSGIQNGPDGLALDVAGSLVEFISYEGSFTGVGGPADGATSVDIGVSEATSAAVGSSLGRTGGPGSSSADFGWTFFDGQATPGQENFNQSLEDSNSDGGGGDDGGGDGGGGDEPSVPEPFSLVVWAGLFGVMVTWRRRFLGGATSDGENR